MSVLEQCPYISPTPTLASSPSLMRACPGLGYLQELLLEIFRVLRDRGFVGLTLCQRRDEGW
jgi:hypothetical protein